MERRGLRKYCSRFPISDLSSTRLSGLRQMERIPTMALWFQDEAAWMPSRKFWEKVKYVNSLALGDFNKILGSNFQANSSHRWLRYFFWNQGTLPCSPPFFISSWTKLSILKLVQCIYKALRYFGNTDRVHLACKQESMGCRCRCAHVSVKREQTQLAPIRPSWPWIDDHSVI